MKSPLATLFPLLCLSALTTAAQDPMASASLADRGPHHTVLELPGVTGSPPRRVTVLENGANYLADDGWRKSEPRFEQVPQGYLASRIQHRVRIAADLFQRGAVAIRTPSGIDLSSTPLAVTLRHGTNLLVIGSITNCMGTLLDDTHVYFDRPFGPDLCCGIMFSISKDTWDQSVYFFGRVDPRDYGMPLDQFTILSVWTECYQTNPWHKEPSPTP